MCRPFERNSLPIYSCLVNSFQSRIYFNSQSFVNAYRYLTLTRGSRAEIRKVVCAIFNSFLLSFDLAVFGLEIVTLRARIVSASPPDPFIDSLARDLTSSPGRQMEIPFIDGSQCSRCLHLGCHCSSSLCPRALTISLAKWVADHVSIHYHGNYGKWRGKIAD